MPPVFLKAFILLSFYLLQAQRIQRKNDMTTTSKYTSIFQCACDGGACFLGPAKRCEVVLPGSQRRLHAVGGEVTEMEGSEAMLRGPPPR